jgi:catechol 2,3-dioxygenase-like lactoylglutathione lyase family enzyme
VRIQAKFVHVNLVARDWRRLVAFYEQVFGCVPMPPERDLDGGWLEDATGIPGARIQGMHLRLPGCGESGPTLEIFQYTPQGEHQEPAPNRPGWGHLALSVDDVGAARQAVLLAGGGAVGEVVTAAIAGAGRITFAYVTDPEGNIIELQRWEH